MYLTVLASIVFTVLLASGFGSASASKSSESPSSNTLFFITNDPQGNNVVAVSVDAEGNLNYTGSTTVGGLGVHGLIDPAGPILPDQADATFSQGIVQVHQEKGLLATVNTVNHTVVLFKIDPEEPGNLTMLGNPVLSGGTFPNSVVFNRAGDRLYVLNSGELNGVTSFNVTKHGLIAQPDSFRELGLNQTTPATGPFGVTSQIAFTEDERNIVVTVKRFFEDTRPGFLAAWPVDEEGCLAQNYTQIPTPSGGGSPFSLMTIQGANAFFATDFDIGVDIFDFSDGLQGVNKSSRTVAIPIEGQVASCWSAYSPAVDRYYSVDVVQNEITEFVVDANLTTSIVSSFNASLGPLDTVVVETGNRSYLYTLLAGSLQIGAWRLDDDGGLIEQTFLDLSVVEQDGISITPNLTQGLALYQS